MDNTPPSVPEDTKVHTLVIDDHYKAQALEQVTHALRDNQYDPSEIKLARFEGEVLVFQAETILTLITKLTKKTVPGRVTGPVKVESDVAAQNEIVKAYQTLRNDKDTQRKIRDVVLNRDDRGFACDNIFIPLPFWKKEFVVFAPCHTCRAQGTIPCHACSGKGMITCPRCHGSGTVSCSQCRGAQMIMGPNGTKIQCPTCHGSGRTPCNTCGQSGRVQCKTCGGKGVMTCPNCKGHAWNSHINIVDLEARTAFDYPRDRLPERVVAMIETYKANIEDYADITVSQVTESVVNAQSEEKVKEQAEATERKDVTIPVIYDVTLPYGHVEYDLGGTCYYMFLFGKGGALTHVSPFLDDILKGGRRKLTDAVEGRGDIIDNLVAASQYRTVREGLLYSAQHTTGKAKKLLKKANPLALSDTVITEIVHNADQALRMITKKPRIVGLAAASLFSFIMLAVYFLLPVRIQMMSHFPNASLHPVLDGVLFALMVFIGSHVIQATARSTLRNAFKAIFPRYKNKAALTPKLGRIWYWYTGISCGLALLFLELTRHGMGAAVTWYYNLFI